MRWLCPFLFKGEKIIRVLFLKNISAPSRSTKKMFDGVSYIERPTLLSQDRTISSYVRRISIAPDGSAAPFTPQGYVNLYDQATQWFGVLRHDNVFTGSNNVFQGNVQVQRCHMTTRVFF